MILVDLLAIRDHRINQRYTENTNDPLLFSDAQGIYGLSPERTVIVKPKNYV
jgi:hypothetical protein